MDRSRFEVLLPKYVLGALSSDERGELDDLLARYPDFQNELEQTDRVLQKSQGVGCFVRLDHFRHADCQKVLKRIKERKTSVAMGHRIGFVRWVAASVAVVLVSSTMWYLYENVAGFGKWQAVTAHHGVEVFELPDRSSVALNQNSRLLFMAAPDAGKRIVKLKGEAFFDVTPDKSKPFVVETAGVEVKVLGTSFNVRQQKHDHSVEVYVSTGKVALNHDDQSILLHPNERGIYKDGVFKKYSLRNANTLYWKNHELVFTDNTLGEVAESLNDAFEQIKIVQVVAVDNRTRITTRFAGQSLEEIFTELQVHFNQSFKVENGVLVVGK